MSGILILGPEEQALIKGAITRARARIAPWEEMKKFAFERERKSLSLEDVEKAKEFLKKYPPQQLELGTYRVAFSFEYQPGGLMRHISVSSRNSKKVPGLEVIKMLLEEFGFSGWPLQRPNDQWAEEFEKGHHAINIIEQEPEEIQVMTVREV